MRSPRSPLLVGLYWGLQFAHTGWGKPHNFPQVTDFFTFLHFSRFYCWLCRLGRARWECSLDRRIFSRFTGLTLDFNMFVAYWTANSAALQSVSSDPRKFFVADPRTFLFASLTILIFGAGLFSVEGQFAKRFARRVTTKDVAIAD